MIRQKSRSTQALSHLLLLSLLFGQVPVNAMAGDPLPSNPDEYDVPKYQRLLEDAQRRADQEERKLEQLEATADQAAATLSTNQQHLATLTDRINRSTADLASLTKVTQALESEVTQLQASLSSLNSQIQDAQSDLRDAEKNLANIQSELDAANREISAKQAAYDSKNRELQPILKQITLKQSALDTAKANLSAAKTRITANRSEKSNLTARLSELKNRESSISRDIERAKSEVTNAATALEKAQEEIASTGKVLREAEAKLREAQAAGASEEIIKRLTQEVEEAKRTTQTARVKFQETAARKKEADATLSRLTNELTSIHTEIPSTERRISELETQISRDEQLASSLDSQVTTLTNELEKLKSESESLTREVTSLKAELDRVKAESEEIRSKAATLQAKVNEARARVTSLTTKLEQTKRKISDNQTQISQNRDRISKIRDSLPILQREKEQTLAVIEITRGVLAQANAAALEQRNRVRDVRVIEQQATMRFRVVQTNLQRGLEVADREGRRDGREAAGREGQIQGTEAGNRDGAIAGEREGATSGRAEGIRIAESQGNAEGQKRGSTDGNTAGRSEGMSAGTAAGAKEGHEQGIAQGRDQGNQKGAAEGSSEGTRIGHSQGAYERGVNEGTISGKVRAEKEGNEKGLADGKKQADKEALGIKLTNVKIPVNNPTHNLVQSVSFISAKSKVVTTQNRLGRYPIPALDRAYEASFRETYRTVYDAQYSAAAEAAYDRAYQASYRNSYDRAVRGNFDAEYRAAYEYSYSVAEKKAYDLGYEITYKSGYDSAYDTAFDKVFKGSYEEAYRVAYQSAYDEARKSTMAADLTKGRKDGDRNTYAKEFPLVYNSVKAAAYSARKALYDSKAVLQFQNATAHDENTDGVNVPGEVILLNLGVKNFGRVASDTNVSAELSVPSSGLEILSPSSSLPVVPGLSNALVQGVRALRIRPTAAIGAKESVQVSILEAGEIIGTSKVEITVGTTLSLTLIETAPKVSAKIDNTIRILVKNLSKKASAVNAQVEVLSTDGLSTLASSVLPIGVLVGATSTELKTSFRFLDAPAPEKLSFQVVIRVGDATFDSKVLNVKSAERFAYNSTSKGVLLVNTADSTGLAQQARKASGLGLDLFDERQEGALPTTTAAKYVSKLIVIPEVNSAMKTVTVASVKSAISKGANLLIGIDEKSAKTEIGLVGTSAAKKNPVRDLLGVRLSERNVFKTDAPKAKIILTNPASVIGTEGLSNALLISDIVLKSVTDKTKEFLAASTVGDTKTATFLRTALISELSQEMSDDVVISGKNFERSTSKVKLTQLITLLMGSTDGEKRVLGTLHAELEAARASLKGREARKAAILQILAPLKAAADGTL